MATSRSKEPLFSKLNLRIAAIILSAILLQSVAVGSVLATSPEPVINQYGTATGSAYPKVELQWKPVKPVAGEDVAFSVLFRAASGEAKSHVDFTFTISMEGKAVYTVSRHTHSGADTVNQKLEAGTYAITVTITGIDFNKVEPQSSDFSINVEKQVAQEQPGAATLVEVVLAISTLKESYGPNEIVSTKVSIQGGKPGDVAVAKIISPDGRVASSVKIAIAEEKFETTVSIGSVPSGAAAGTWKVTLEYAGKVASNTFKITEVKPEVATKPVISLQIKGNRDTFTFGNSVPLKGIIKQGSGTSGNKIMIVITGSDGKVYLRNEVEPARDGSFEVNFDIKSGYPTGTWNIEAIIINEPQINNRISFKVIEPEPSATPAKTAAEKADVAAIRLLDSNGQEVRTIKTGGEGPEGGLVEYVLALDGKGFKPSTDLTILVLDPDEDVYLQNEVKTGSDGSFRSGIMLAAAQAKQGTWSIQVITGDSIEELTFDVISSAAGQAEGTAVIKNLKKMTMIVVKNSGTEDIWKISIKVNQGSIQFVKAISKQFKDWERKRVAQDKVSIVVNDPTLSNRESGSGAGLVINEPGLNNKAVNPGESIIIIMKWKDRPDLPRDMKVKSGEDGNSPLGLVINEPGLPSDKKQDK